MNVERILYFFRLWDKILKIRGYYKCSEKLRIQLEHHSGTFFRTKDISISVWLKKKSKAAHNPR